MARLLSTTPFYGVPHDGRLPETGVKCSRWSATLRQRLFELSLSLSLVSPESASELLETLVGSVGGKQYPIEKFFVILLGMKIHRREGPSVPQKLLERFHWFRENGLNGLEVVN